MQFLHKQRYLLGALIIGLVLRLVSLSQSLWLDETITANVAKHFSYLDIVQKFSPTDFHPPLYYLLIKLWTTILGYSETMLRVPSVIFGVLTVLLAYAIAKKLYGAKTGLWAAVLSAVNPLLVYYSQEARMYSMVTFLLTLAWYLSLKLQEPKHRVRHTLAHGICIFLAVTTFYGSLFFIAALAGMALIQKHVRTALCISVAALMALLVLSPLLSLQAQNAQILTSTLAKWNTVLGTVTLKNLLLVPLKFATGRISFEPKILYFAVGGIGMSILIFSVLQGIRNNRKLSLLAFAPLFTATLISFLVPMLQYFRFLYLIPVWLVLSAGSRLRSVLVSFFLVFSLLYIFFPVFHREDWRSLTTYIDRGEPLYMVKSSTDPLQYYAPDIESVDLRSVSSVLVAPSIQVIPYTADIHGIAYGQILQSQGYSLRFTKQSRGLSLEEWVKE